VSIRPDTGVELDAADRPEDTEGRTATVGVAEASGRRRPKILRRSAVRLRWWREVLLVAGFYLGYSIVRDIHGDRPVSIFRASHNAHRVIRLEQDLHIFVEQKLQHAFLGDHALIRFLDDFYGTVHFAAVIAVLVLLYFRYPARYPLWRNTLALCSLMALIGFAFFPLLPPRMLPPSYHFVDTLKTIGGLWNFSSGPVNSVSNQYAAMPSLHTAWSAWSALAVLPLIRPWWGKILALGYPVLTIFCIVVTGNHYFADAIGGLLLLGVAYLLAIPLTTLLTRLHLRWRANHPRWSDPAPSAAPSGPGGQP
jgi:membrane-associated phospholipid phosphatase